MSADPAGSVTQVFLMLRQGDGAAAAELWRRYYPRLLALARTTLAGRPQRVADAEDAVQSAFVAFWRQVSDGQAHALLRRDDLWGLLGVITVRKALKHAQRERAKKRGGGQVACEGDLTGGASGGDEVCSLDGVLSADAAQACRQWPAQEFDLLCEELLSLLDDEMRAIAFYKLMGHTHQEIAGLLQCTERKIERKVALIRKVWEKPAGD